MWRLKAFSTVTFGGSVVELLTWFPRYLSLFLIYHQKGGTRMVGSDLWWLLFLIILGNLKFLHIARVLWFVTLLHPSWLLNIHDYVMQCDKGQKGLVMQGMYWDVSKDWGMSKLYILGVLNHMLKIQGEPWLIQANEGQEIGLRSLGDQMNIHMDSKGTHHPN